MDHQELYENHCKPLFEALLEGQDEILKALKGDVDKAGLCERIRDLEKSKANIIKGLSVVASTVLVQTVALLKKWIFG